MPTRRNDALDAHLYAYSQEALAQLQDILYTVQPIIVPSSIFDSMFDSPPVMFDYMFDSHFLSLKIATEEPPEETVVESNEELDNFLKEFALKDVS